jgi:L-fucose isomerase-like protein
MSRVGLVSFVTPWFDVAQATRNLQAARELLAREHEVFGPKQPVVFADGVEDVAASLHAADVDVLVLQPGTFPDGAGPTRLAERLQVPIVVHSLAEPHLDGEVPLNSLCGANLITYTLTQLDLPHTHVHGDDERLLAHVAAAGALATMRRTTLHVIGSRVPGFFPCAYDEIVARRTFGIATEYIGLQEVYDGLAKSEATEANERYHAAVAGVLEAHGADVVAIRDWPELYVDGEHGGIWPGLGWLQDAGNVVAVEGDANAALTMAIERCFSELPPMLTDVVASDDDRSTLLLWHYAAPQSLAADEVRLSDDGKEVEFTLRPGAATLARVGLDHGRLRLITVAVEVLDEPVRLRRAGGVARTVATPAPEVVRELLDGGWEHHLCLVYGDVSEQFAALARYAGLEHTRL